jgi:hypothetical protein
MTVGVENMIMGSKAFMVKFLKSSDGARRVAPEACLGRGARSEAKFNMYYIGFYTDNIMKPHGSVRVVRMWSDEHIDPILRCFINQEGLNYGDLLVGMVHEFTS